MSFSRVRSSKDDDDDDGIAFFDWYGATELEVCEKAKLFIVCF